MAEEQSPTTLTFLGSRDLGGATAVWLVIGLFEDKGFAFVAVFFDGDAGATGGPQRDASLPKVLLPLPDILGGFLLPLSLGIPARQRHINHLQKKKREIRD